MLTRVKFLRVYVGRRYRLRQVNLSSLFNRRKWLWFCKERGSYGVIFPVVIFARRLFLLRMRLKGERGRGGRKTHP